MTLKMNKYGNICYKTEMIYSGNLYDMSARNLNDLKLENFIDT